MGEAIEGDDRRQTEARLNMQRGFRIAIAICPACRRRVRLTDSNTHGGRLPSHAVPKTPRRCPASGMSIVMAKPPAWRIES
jgi:hypothetical protein